MIKFFCSLGWHWFSSTGWAKRVCKLCGLFQINLYLDGNAEWQKPPADWVELEG